MPDNPEEPETCEECGCECPLCRCQTNTGCPVCGCGGEGNVTQKCECYKCGTPVMEIVQQVQKTLEGGEVTRREDVRGGLCGGCREDMP